MPYYYSEDLRMCVLNKIENDASLSIKDISLLFGVSRSAIYDWINLKKATGSLKFKPKKQKGHSHKIKDWQAFKQFYKNNDGRTLVEMASKWPEDISTETIRRGLIKLKSRKMGS